MSSAETTPQDRSARFGLRLTVWYATLFISSSFAIVLITYLLTSSSLAERDHQIIEAKLGEYATVYASGGLRALAATMDVEQRTSGERVFVRVLDGGSEAVLLSNAEGWNVSTLEVATLQLRDGSIVQVGKSTEARRDILARFRATLGLVTLAIIVIALTGGWIATQSAVAPIRRLSGAVRRIIDTGRTLSYMMQNLQTRRPASIKVCALLDKPTRRQVYVPIAYLGFEIPDKFVVGYGLDFNEHYRNLPYVGVLKPEMYA